MIWWSFHRCSSEKAFMHIYSLDNYKMKFFLYVNWNFSWIPKKVSIYIQIEDSKLNAQIQFISILGFLKISMSLLLIFWAWISYKKIKSFIFLIFSMNSIWYNFFNWYSVRRFFILPSLKILIDSRFSSFRQIILTLPCCPYQAVLPCACFITIEFDL